MAAYLYIAVDTPGDSSFSVLPPCWRAAPPSLAGLNQAAHSSSQPALIHPEPLLQGLWHGHQCQRLWDKPM